LENRKVLALWMEAYIDISQWWPKAEDGSPLSVYAVHRQFEGTPNEVTRHTLTVARDGKLKKADIDNLVKLARICSQLSGDLVTINDIVKIEED
jgi:DNA-binding Xre family transcriptional regulator